MKKISIIIPTYNERENLPVLIRKIARVFKQDKIDGKVVVVDDNSPDGTGEIAENLKKKYKFLKVIHRHAKLGLGSAYVAGFQATDGELVFTMDSDLSHDPRYMPRFLKAAKCSDVVVGSRYIKGGKIIGWGPYRNLVSKTANFLAKLVVRGGVNDVTSGYRAYKRDVFKQISKRIESSGYAFQLEMMYKVRKSGFMVKPVPIVFMDRKKGKSKLGVRDIISFLRLAIKLGLKSEINK